MIAIVGCRNPAAGDGPLISPVWLLAYALQSRRVRDGPRVRARIRDPKLSVVEDGERSPIGEGRDVVNGTSRFDRAGGVRRPPKETRVAEAAGLEQLFDEEPKSRANVRPLALVDAEAPPLERDEAPSSRSFDGIVTCDDRMLAALALVARVAASTASVVLRGETGTGKELVARALHLNSPRRSRPFVALHCGALSPDLIESELFGHVRGAFTGAGQDRAGRIAAAHGGTLLLDEVAEIPLTLQAKLLRVIQFGEIQRVGSDRVEQVDVRVVTASHRNLADAVRAGEFREDLYYRLKVVEIVLPPLRERPADIPLLVEHALRRYWVGPNRPSFAPEARALLARHAWPGNVRELEHVCERACLLARGPALGADLLPAEITERRAERAASGAGGELAAYTLTELQRVKADALDRIEKSFLSGLLEKSGQSVSGAARLSGIHRGQLQKMLARAGVRPQLAGRHPAGSTTQPPTT